MTMALFAAYEAFNGAFEALFLIIVQTPTSIAGGCEQFRSVLTKEAPHVARETSTVKFDAKVVASFTDVHLAQAVKIVGISDDLDLVAAYEKAVQNTLGGRARRARSHTIST
jgi:hypothetical protein